MHWRRRVEEERSEIRRGVGQLYNCRPLFSPQPKVKMQAPARQMGNNLVYRWVDGNVYRKST